MWDDIWSASIFAVLVVEFMIMILYIVMTNIKILSMSRDSRDASIAINARIARAISDTSRITTLKTFTVAAYVAPALAKNEQGDTLLGRFVNTDTSAYPLYLVEKARGKLVALSSKSSSLRNFEFLAFKNTVAGNLLETAVLRGDIEYLIIGGAAFMVLKFVGSTDYTNGFVTQNANHDTPKDNDIIIPVIAMGIANFVDRQSVTEEYTLQPTALVMPGTNSQSLVDILKQKFSVSNGIALVNIIGY